MNAKNNGTIHHLRDNTDILFIGNNDSSFLSELEISLANPCKIIKTDSIEKAMEILSGSYIHVILVESTMIQSESDVCRLLGNDIGYPPLLFLIKNQKNMAITTGQLYALEVQHILDNFQRNFFCRGFAKLFDENVSFSKNNYSNIVDLYETTRICGSKITAIGSLHMLLTKLKKCKIDLMDAKNSSTFNEKLLLTMEQLEENFLFQITPQLKKAHAALYAAIKKDNSLVDDRLYDQFYREIDLFNDTYHHAIWEQLESVA